MATATIPVPDVMQFKLDTEKVFKEVRHYHLISGKLILSNKLNIGINRGFSKANYTYSVKKWNGSQWSKQITGLFPTHHSDIFYGDTNSKKNLVLAMFTNDGEILKIWHFENFYTSRIEDFLKAFKDTYSE